MRNKRYDKVFFWTVCAAVLAGFFILFSASMGLLSREGADFSDVIFKQALFGLAGFALFLITSRIHYKKWRKFALPIFIFCFLLTILVFLPYIGFSHGGARRWINLGIISFQPSEFLKISFIIYIASWIAGRKDDIKSFKFGLLPFLVIMAFVGLVLIAEPDIGTLGVVAITAAFLFFIGGGKSSQLALIFFLGMALLCVLVLIKPHAMNRITVFLNPGSDPQGIGYQLKQSLIAVGSGGIFGRGFGMSIQKFHFLPEPIGDSIFAVFAEEFGFLGGMALVVLLLFLLYRGFKIVMAANDSFARLLGAGIIISVIVQSFINIGSIIGVIPLTGVTLVFISQGGSSLLATLAGFGILLNISKNG